MRLSPPDLNSPGDIASCVTNKSCSRPGPDKPTSYAVSSTLADDRLILDISQPNCGEYFAIERGIASRCGGRTFDHDVTDVNYGLMIGNGVSDNVAEDNDTLGTWPFIGAANSRR